MAERARQALVELLLALRDRPADVDQASQSAVEAISATIMDSLPKKTFERDDLASRPNQCTLQQVTDCAVHCLCSRGVGIYHAGMFTLPTQPMELFVPSDLLVTNDIHVDDLMRELQSRTTTLTIQNSRRTTNCYHVFQIS